MSNSINNPIASSHQHINNHLRALNEMLESIEKAKQVGTPMAAEHDQLRQYLINQLMSIKTAFFPDKP